MRLGALVVIEADIALHFGRCGTHSRPRVLRNICLVHAMSMYRQIGAGAIIPKSVSFGGLRVSESSPASGERRGHLPGQPRIIQREPRDYFHGRADPAAGCPKLPRFTGARNNSCWLVVSRREGFAALT